MYCQFCCQYVEDTEACDLEHDDSCEFCGQPLCDHGEIEGP